MRANLRRQSYHKVDGAKPVHLVSVNLAVLGVLDDGMVVNALSDTGNHVLHLLGERGVDALHDDGAVLEILRKHHVGGHKVLVDGGVVRGPEEAAHHANVVLDRVTLAAVGDDLGRRRRVAGPGVRRVVDAAVGGVRADHEALGRLEQHLDRLAPRELAEKRRVASGLVVVVRQLEKGGDGVELVLALPDLVGVVGRADRVAPGKAVQRATIALVMAGRNLGLGGRLEGVTVRVLAKVAALQVDGAAVELGDIVGVVVRGGVVEDGLIRLELVGAVAQPHGVDVSGNYKGQLKLIYG